MANTRRKVDCPIIGSSEDLVGVVLPAKRAVMRYLNFIRDRFKMTSTKDPPVGQIAIQVLKERKSIKRKNKNYARNQDNKEESALEKRVPKRERDFLEDQI
ncbi:hypothetical protein FQA39_LY08757 [Lamprigera yunnana]|nr:hypothetical protein FQA39_LY08757 [Lamprigera yunnana]